VYCGESSTELCTAETIGVTEVAAVIAVWFGKGSGVEWEEGRQEGLSEGREEIKKEETKGGRK
jgi:hypothetical protein